MSDTAKPTELSAAQGEGQTIENTQSVAATTTVSVEERLAQMERTNLRLLNESKENKQKYQLLKDQKDKEEKEMLTQKENWKGLYELEKKNSDEREGKAQAFKQNAISKFLDYEILKHAPEAHDPKLIKQALDINLVSAIEEDNEIKFNGLAENIEKIKKEKTFLFKNQTVPQMTSVKPGSPTAKSLNGAAPKTAQQMTRDELKAYWQANPQLK